MHSVEIDQALSGPQCNPMTCQHVNSFQEYKTNTHAVPGEAPTKVNGWQQELDDDGYAVLALRNLIFDICNHNGGGHGGSAIGMSAIGVALYKYVMRYNPSDSEWFDRDRFVLSNGEHRPKENCSHTVVTDELITPSRPLCYVPLCAEPFGRISKLDYGRNQRLRKCKVKRL